MPMRIPQFSLLREPSTAVVQVCCGTVICGRRVGHVSVYLFTLRFPSIETPISASPSLLPKTITQPELQSSSFALFIQALTAKHGMLTLPPVTRSRYTHHRSGHSLSSYVSGWLLQQELLSKPWRSKVVASPCT